MKFISKTIFVLIIVFAVSTNVFAKASFEMAVNLSGGGAMSFKSFVFDTSQISKEGINNIKKNTLSDVGFEYSGNILLGVDFFVNTNTSMGVFVDLGYGNDFFGFIQKNTEIKNYWFQLNNVRVGGALKVNISNFSIGFGGGIKLLLNGAYYQSKDGKHLEISSKNSWYQALKHNDLKKYYLDSVVVPYAKLTFDYLFRVHKNININLGLYTAYDFPLQLKEKYSYAKEYLNGFDFGINVGFVFRTIN